MVASPQVSWPFFKARATSISKGIRKERATPKNGQLAAAQRVAMKMGRRLRWSLVAYPFRYAPLLAPCRRPILIATMSPLYARRYTRVRPESASFAYGSRGKMSHGTNERLTDGKVQWLGPSGMEIPGNRL